MNNTEIVEIEETMVLTAFSSGEGLEPIINDVVAIVAGFKHDMSTDAKRAKTKTLASKISRFKTKLDNLGKGLVSEWKTQSKAVDQSRKKMRDQLDELKIVARKPLTEWEEAEQRRKNEEAAIFLAEQARAKYELDHEMGLLLDEKYDREEAARKDVVEKERLAAEKRLEETRLAREKEIRETAAKQAKLEAEEKAQKESLRVEQEKQAAQQRAKQAERDTIAAEERAKAQAELAEKQKIEAEAAAKKEMKAAAEMAKQDEIDRQAREAAKDKAEEEKREANNRHVSGVLKKAKLALISAAGIDEESAKKVILAIRSNQIPSVFIRF